MGAEGADNNTSCSVLNWQKCLLSEFSYKYRSNVDSEVFVTGQIFQMSGQALICGSELSFMNIFIAWKYCRYKIYIEYIHWLKLPWNDESSFVWVSCLTYIHFRSLTAFIYKTIITFLTVPYLIKCMNSVTSNTYCFIKLVLYRNKPKLCLVMFSMC